MRRERTRRVAMGVCLTVLSTGCSAILGITDLPPEEDGGMSSSGVGQGPMSSSSGASLSSTSVCPDEAATCNATVTTGAVALDCSRQTAIGNGGFAFAYADSAGSSACADASSLCATGNAVASTAATSATAYGAGLGVSLNQASLEGTPNSYSVTGSGISYALSNLPAGLQLVIDDGGTQYYAPISAPSGTILWAQFVSQQAVVLAGAPSLATHVEFQVGPVSSAVEFDFCVTALTFDPCELDSTITSCAGNASGYTCPGTSTPPSPAACTSGVAAGAGTNYCCGCSAVVDDATACDECVASQCCTPYTGCFVDDENCHGIVSCFQTAATTDETIDTLCSCLQPYENLQAFYGSSSWIAVTNCLDNACGTSCGVGLSSGATCATSASCSIGATCVLSSSDTDECFQVCCKNADCPSGSTCQSTTNVEGNPVTVCAT